jgi:YhcH/YjgK/YiaL family protein
MIYDRIENAARYFPKGSALCDAVQYVATFDPSHPDGTFLLRGNDVYAIVKRYTTFPVEQKQFETHREYIDVQVLLSGMEAIHVSLATDLAVLEPYDVAFDKARPHPPKDFSTILLRPGKFAVFFPGDFHRPDCIWGTPMPVRKICIKVRVGLAGVT